MHSLYRTRQHTYFFISLFVISQFSSFFFSRHVLVCFLYCCNNAEKRAVFLSVSVARKISGFKSTHKSIHIFLYLRSLYRLLLRPFFTHSFSRVRWFVLWVKISHNLAKSASLVHRGNILFSLVFSLILHKL